MRLPVYTSPGRALEVAPVTLETRPASSSPVDLSLFVQRRPVIRLAAPVASEAMTVSAPASTDTATSAAVSSGSSSAVSSGSSSSSGLAPVPTLLERARGAWAGWSPLTKGAVVVGLVLALGLAAKSLARPRRAQANPARRRKGWEIVDDTHVYWPFTATELRALRKVYANEEDARDAAYRIIVALALRGKSGADLRVRPT